MPESLNSKKLLILFSGSFRNFNHSLKSWSLGLPDGWDVDVISGLYIQRIPGRHTLELYRSDEHGNVTNIPWDDIKQRIGLQEVTACGFGCVLIKGEVLRKMEYPHFVYKSAIDHAHTHSEDVYFCLKAKENGFRVWCDTTILCDHVGSFTFKVQDEKPKSVIEYIRDEDRLDRKSTRLNSSH